MISLGQTLHGYQDGHSLLAGSEELPYEAESILFVLSDLSGQSFVEGFDSYITGYPLLELGAFALARTWYASEMERPGCVWTHTLLIAFGDLARISDLSLLARMFVRPTRNEKSWRRYERRADFQEKAFSEDSETISKPQPRLLRELLGALYGSPRVPVVLPSSRSSRSEEAFLRVWAQQWPRLRRNFSFCTGAIEARFILGQPFDLQCMPTDYASLGSPLPSGAFVIGRATTPDRLLDVVLSTIYADFEHPDERLRSFLRNYAADAPGERSSFAPLVQVWQSLLGGISTESQFEAIVSLVFAKFPSVETAAKLKNELLIGDHIADLNVSLPVDDRLLKLFEMKVQGVEAIQSLDLATLAEKVAIHSPVTFIKLLDRTIRVHRLGEIVAELLNIATGSVADTVLEEAASEQLLLVLVSLRASLLERSGLWHRISERGHEVVDIFASKRASNEEWRALTRALILERVKNTAALAFTRSPIDLTPIALDVCQGLESYSDDLEPWFNEVEKRQPVTAAWLLAQSELSVANRFGLASVLDPVFCTQASVKVGGFQGVQDDWNDRRLAFIFVLAAGDASNKASEIFATSFLKLHRFVVADTLTYFSWKILQQVLPQLSYFGNWDTAERLRRYYVSRYAESHWPQRIFWSGLEGAEVTWEILHYLASEKGLRGFGRTLVENAPEQKLPAWQLEVISRAPKKLRR